MAEHKVQGGDMLLFIDPAGGTDYSMVVCLTSVGVSDSVSVVDASSACGPDKSPGTLEISYSFEGQHLQDPTTGQISGTDLRILLRSETTIGWKLSPETPVDGDEIHTGTGYLSELSSTYAFDSVGVFTGTLQPYGTPEITIYGGGGGFTIGQDYQGGKIAYIDGTGEHGIIVAWTDDSHVNVWSDAYAITGCTNDALYAGLTDTNVIEGLYATSAGWDTRQLTQGGYTDWCLPTANDWYAMRPNCSALSINFFGLFWTCNENTGDANNALAFDPFGNTTMILDKSGLGVYIAVRYF
jgi:hypothetical protein